MKDLSELIKDATRERRYHEIESQFIINEIIACGVKPKKAKKIKREVFDRYYK
jgi:hypothetical protein